MHLQRHLNEKIIPFFYQELRLGGAANNTDNRGEFHFKTITT